MEPEIKEEFMRLISEEGKTASAEIGASRRQYIKNIKAQQGE